MEMTLETKKDIVEDMLMAAGTKKTMEWLESAGYYTAPASKGHHGAQEGALFEHSLQVAYELINLTDRLELKWERRESPGIIGLLHDVCKMDDYLLKSTEGGARGCLEPGESMAWPWKQEPDHAHGAHRAHRGRKGLHHVPHGCICGF